jgi:hypothetical protein
MGRRLALGLILLLLTAPLVMAAEWARTYRIEGSDFIKVGEPLILRDALYLPGIYESNFSSLHCLHRPLNGGGEVG